jgi:hypothetical protein
MNCSVCGKKGILKTPFDLRCDGNYFCELHFPCVDKQGLRTSKFDWPPEQQVGLVQYFIAQLRSKTPERTISGSHLIGDINVVHTDLPGIDLHDVGVHPLCETKS